MKSPERLAEIVGNEKLIGLLRQGTLPPSALFVGCSGIGKRTTALLLAALGNCRSPRDQDVCGKCSSCIKALSGNHPDITLIRAEKNTIKIGQIRELNVEAQYRPFEGRKRYFVVDDAEKMTTEAANSLLKTLEEPPPTTHIVLITAHAEALLSTIRSRCQTFAFHSLGREEVVRFLENREESEEPRKDVALRANFSGGTIGKALSLDLEKQIADRDRMLALLSGWIEKQSFSDVFQTCEELGGQLKNRESVKAFLENLQLLCYDLYYLSVDTPERIVSEDRLILLETLRGQVSIEQLRRLLEAISEAKRDVDRYVNPLICFETLWLRSLRD